MPFEDLLTNLEASNPELAAMAGRVAEPQQEGASLLDDELFAELATSVNIDSSASSAFMKKFSETTEFTESAGDYLTRKMPESPLSGRIMFRDEDGDFTLPHYVSANEYFGEDFTKLSEDERRLRINDKKAEEIDQYYGSVVTGGAPIAAGAGVITGYLTDPTTAAPLGATYKGAAAIGAGIGAGDIAMEQLARDGKVEATDVALGAVLGGVLGPVVKYAGDTFMPWVKDSISKGGPISADDIMKQIPQEFVESGDVTLDTAQRLSEALSASLDLTPKGYLSHSVASVNDLLGGSERGVRRSAEEALFTQRVATITQDDVTPVLLNRMTDNEASFRVKYGDEGFLSAAKAKIDIDQAMKDAVKTVKPAEPITPKKVAKTVKAKVKDEVGAARVTRSVDAEMKRLFEDVDEAGLTDYQRSIEKSVAMLMPEDELGQERVAKEILQELEEEGEILAKPKLEDKAAKEVAKKEKAVVTSFKEFSKRSGKDKEGGFAAPWLMRDIALSSAGGLAGYTSSGGDIETAAMWAIGTGAVAHGIGVIGPKLYNKVGKLTPYSVQVNEEVADSWGRKYMSYAWTERPSEFFKNVAGDTGHKFTNLLQSMTEDIRGRMAEDLIDVDQGMFKFGIARKSAEEKGVVDILRNPGKAKSYGPNVQQAAQLVRNKLNTIVKDAVGRKIIKPEAGRKMLDDSITKGYFPRVYDRFFLASAEGKAKWNKVLKDHHWTKEEIESAAKDILGQKDIAFERFTQVVSKKGEARYTVDNKFIAELYKNNAKATFSNRSTHLEKGRKIKLPDKVLEPFLINDLHDVLGSYFHDTQKRIQAAKYFGNADQGMHQIIKEMKAKGLTKLETNAAWDVFWTSVGDPKSNSIRQMIEMPQELRNLFSKASALQTAKLIFAQTLNMTQATANSLIYLPSRVGAKTPKVLLKGIGRTFRKENREWAERIGAAAETTILEVAGEMGALESRYATKFLKYTGFTLVEKLQRQLAANIGKSYAEELLATKSALFVKSRKRGLSKSGKAQLKRINNQLNEIGINPVLSPNSIPVEQMNRAGQRFSNTVNFINTGEKMPLAWQSPYMKVFRQFKTFMFHQGAFLHDNLLKPAKRGDLRPMLGLAAAGGLGMGPSEVRKWLKADDEDYTMTQRYLQGFTAIGSLGLMYDLAQQAANGEGRMASAVLGPSFGDIASVTKAAALTSASIAKTGLKKAGFDVEGKPKVDFKPLARAAVNLPIIGQALDVSGTIKAVGTSIGAGDVVEDLPTRKSIKEELSDKKTNPYSYYSNLYK